MGLAEAEASEQPPVIEPNYITNGRYSIRVEPGAAGIQILRDGLPLFGGEGLSAITVEDPWGAWGGMDEEPESLHLTTIRHRWTVEQVVVQESGPERSSLWVRLVGGSSRMDLTFSLYRDRDAIDVAARVFWDERSARLKMVLSLDGPIQEAEFEVPGGTVRRTPGGGEVPGGRYVSVSTADSSLGFASDALYNFDVNATALHTTVVRASRYSSDFPLAAGEQPWKPATDSGELCFRFLLTGDCSVLPALALLLEQPPVALLVPPSPGHLPRVGSLGS